MRCDSNDKNKKAKVILWCNEFDEVLTYMSSIKEFDLDFHEKIKFIKCGNKFYNKKENNIYDEKYNGKYKKYIIGVKEYREICWEQWKKLLFEYSNEHKKVPIWKTKYKNKNIGNWLSKQKNKIKSNTCGIYIKLSKNKYVKQSLDEYLDPDKKWNDLKDLLFEYCNEHKKVPSIKIKYKNQNIGIWLQNQKMKIKFNTGNIYIKLSKNKYVKQLLDEYLKYKEETKDNIKISWDEWKDLLFEYSNEYKQIPFQTTKYKNQSIGTWLHSKKGKIKSNTDDVYIKLSKNKYVKQSLDEYLKYKEKTKTKDNIKMAWSEWKDILFEYSNEHKKVPALKIKYRDQNIGMWFKGQRLKIKSNVSDKYIKLSKNKYVKQSLDKYLKYKDETKDKIQLSWNELKDLLFEYSNEHKQIPSQKTKYKYQNIGQWFHYQKGKMKSSTDDIYIKLSKNKYIKHSLDEYLDPDKKWNEWKDLLFEYSNKHKKHL